MLYFRRNREASTAAFRSVCGSVFGDLLVPHPSLRRRLLAGLAISLGVGGLALPPLVAQDGPSLPGLDRTAAVDADAADAADAADESDADDFGDPVGLSLALPEDAPDAIRARAWESLPSSWDDWSAETGDRVADLYSGELTLEEQRYTLKRLNVKLRTLRTAINQSQYSKIRGKLVDFEAALSLRVELAEAALDAMQNPPRGAGDAALATEFNKLKTAADKASNDLNNVKNGQLWRKYLRLIDVMNIALRRDTSDDALDELDAVLAKLEGDDADAEQSDFLERDSLVELAAEIDNILFTTEEPPSDAEALGSQIRDLLAAVDEYEANVTGESAAEIKAAMNSYGGLPNAGRFAGILSQRYRGTNVRGRLAESLVQQLLAKSNFERGVVNDCVLGARVVGCQLTNSNLTVDLVPSNTNAQFRLNLSGTVQSKTTGYKKPATVYSVGNHQFSSNKTVTFDGYRFAASPAAIGVNVNNRTTGVTTSIKFPIFRRIARNIARQKVAESAPQVKAITRQKIVENVGERFNREVDTLLSQAESRVQQKLWSPLSLLGLTPQQQSISTTDTSADLAWLVADGDELSAGQAPPLPVSSGGVSAQIHESYLNAFADRMDINGRTFTNEQLRDHVRMKLESALGRSLPMRAQAASADSDNAVANAKFVFADEDAVRLRVENDRIVLLLRTGLELDGKDDIPTQVVEIPLDIERSGSQIVLTQGDVSVSPVEGGGGFRQIARSKVMIQKIEAGNAERVFDGMFNLKLENKQIMLMLQTLEVAGGWITATLR